MEHIWTMLMHKILQNHLLCAFVANLKIGAIYALYPESFCDKNLAVRKVFTFSDSATKQSPVGQNAAPRAEQAPMQLMTFPQVVISIVLSRWQQVAKRNWLKFVNTLLN